MMNKEQIPPWLLSKAFQKSALCVRQFLLIVFQMAGVFMLVMTVHLFFAGSAGDTVGNDQKPSSLFGEIMIIAFILSWNAVVLFMLRSGFRELRQMKLKNKEEQGAS